MNSIRQDDLIKLVNLSGFPFQLGIESEIKKTRKDHGWKVLTREHPWLTPETGASGYADIVLEDKHDVQVMVVECKRVRDSEWVFLVPDRSLTEKRDVRAWITCLEPDRKLVGWYDVMLDPESPWAEFCVVRGQNKDRPILEHIGSELIEATESMALEELHLRKPQPKGRSLRVYFSIIVTTAQIQVCRFSLDDISLAKGELSSAQFEEVPFVRFRKSLTTKLSGDVSPMVRSFENLTEIKKEKERTIIVVNANSFVPLLTQWELSETNPWIR